MRSSLDKQDLLSLHEAKAEKLNPYAKWATKECITRKPRQCKSKIQRVGENFNTFRCFCIFPLSLSTWRIIIVGLRWRGLKKWMQSLAWPMSASAYMKKKKFCKTAWIELTYSIKKPSNQRGVTKHLQDMTIKSLLKKRFHAYPLLGILRFNKCW